MRFLLDANIFIQAHRFYYPFDVFPVFWSWLEQENINGTIGSIDGVLDEIKAGDDALAEWVKALDAGEWFLKSDDEQTQQCFIEIVDSVMADPQFTEAARTEFLSVVDPWLIAKARSEGITIVTEEKSDPNSKRKIFIPDICKRFDIPYINTIGLIRKLNGRF